MNWSNIISEIVAAGFTQQEIATHCGCGQSTISDLYRGAIKQPAYQIGERLIKMRKSAKKAA